MRHIKALFATAAGVAVAAGMGLGLTAASASTAPVNCGSSALTQTGQARESVTVAGVTYNLAAPNTLANGKLAVFKTAVNASSSMTYCNTSGTASEIVIVGQDGVTYALTNRGGDRVFFEVAHGFAAQLWSWAGSSSPNFHFKNLKSGLSIRTPNAGPSNFGPVAAGVHATTFFQTAS